MNLEFQVRNRGAGSKWRRRGLAVIAEIVELTFVSVAFASPKRTQHNVCGRSIYAEGTVDAVQFIAERVAKKSPKTLYDMVDVLRESSA